MLSCIIIVCSSLPCKPNIGDPNVSKLCLQQTGVSPGLLLLLLYWPSLKLPPFWSSAPEVWFQQVEARTRHITAQRTKFDHVVAPLSPEFATEVCDLIIRPPVDAPYDSLREQLIKRTTASEQRKLQQLFSAEELGDRKPSQLLHRLQQLVRAQHIPAGALLEASP